MAYEFQSLKQLINRNVNTIMSQEEQKKFLGKVLILKSIRENEHQDEEFQGVSGIS